MLKELDALFGIDSSLIFCVLYGTVASYLYKLGLKTESKETKLSSAFIVILFKKASLASPELA